jgi:gliding-associated putative ABC transporter substrate-binding component GldG
MSSKVQKRAASESLIFLLLVGGILILLNVLAAYFPSPRVDLTEKGLFSLAEGSERLAGSLDDRLEVTAYFTENLPPPFNATERHVRDLLSEYAAASNGQIIVRFVNPDDEAKQQAARADGVQPVAHQKIEEDQVAVVEGYRGMVLRYLDQSRTMPVIQDTTGLEYMITSAIKELVGERKPIGIVSGHGGPTLAEGLTTLQSVLKLYDLREVDASQEIDTGLAALLIIGPEQPFGDEELRRIDQYVMRGGSLGIFGGALNVDLAGQTGPSAQPVSSRMDGLLGPWGVRMASKIVADAQCSRAPMRGPMGLQVLVPYPPIPVLQLDEEQLQHPVMFRLASPMLPFVAPLEVGDAPVGAQITVLASSSEDSWTMSGPTTIALQPRNPRDWQMSAEAGPFDLMVAIEGKLPSAYVAPINEEEASAIQAPPVAESEVRVLVVGASSFLEDSFMPPRPQQGDVQMNAALALALNAIDWLAADSDLIAIRAKTIEEPALDIPDSVLAAEDTALAAAQEGDEEGVESALQERKAAIESWDGKKRAYRWLNTLGIPFLVALFGLFRWRQRTNKKKTLKV